MLVNLFGELSLEQTQAEIKNLLAAVASGDEDSLQVLENILTAVSGALTDDQLRASPVPVSTGLNQPTTPADTQPASVASLPLPSGAAVESKQLPDNHRVQVSNFPDEYALTDDQLRASPVAVDTGITQPTTPTDTQPISAVALPLPAGAATSAGQLPNNHQVTVSNQPENFPLPAAQITTLTPQKNGLTNTELRASAVPVSVSNSDFPLPSGQVSTLTPQKDALTDSQLRASPVGVSVFGGSTGTNSSVNASTSQVTLLAANANRKGATVYNNSSNNPVYLSLGATASSTNFTLIVESKGYFELPFWYKGIITAACANTNGNIKVSEIT